MSKKCVIIGGGLAGKHAAETLMKKVKKEQLEVTLVTGNKFVEWPLAMTYCLVKPELHSKALSGNPDKFQVPGVAYKYGVVEIVDPTGKQVKLAGGEDVPYDVLIVATGFGVPLIYPRLGMSLEERKTEVQAVGDAIKKASSVVVAGGGVIGLELAGDVRAQYPDKAVTLLARGVLSQWPEKMKTKVEAQLKKLKIEVVNGDNDAPKDYSLQQGTINCGGTSVSYDVFVPAYSTGPNTSFLQKVDGILDDKKRVEVNEFLQSKKHNEIFAIGVSSAPEPFVAMPKLEAQWNTVTANISLMLAGKPMQKHKEGAPFMKLPAMLLIGHGPNAWGMLDFAQLPPPLKCCCCNGLGGFPCCPPCWPCCLCGGCGACPCGLCCMPPEGSGPAKFAGKAAFLGAGMHFKGMGESAPTQQSMN